MGSAGYMGSIGQMGLMGHFGYMGHMGLTGEIGLMGQMVKSTLFYIWHISPTQLAGAVVQRAGLLITWSLVRTHSGASFVINFASLSPASAWPSLA